MTTRLLSLLLAVTATLHAKDLRVLEITSDAIRIPGTVEFLGDAEGTVIVETQTTANKSFDWLDIPEGAKAARMKVGDVSTETFALADTGTTLFILGQPTVAQDAKGAPKAVLAGTVKTDRAQAAAGLTGWVYFGTVKAAAPAAVASAPWHTLFVVQPPKTNLLANHAPTFEMVKAQVVGNRVRADFPLILRQRAADGTIDRKGESLTIRAGQYLEVKSLNDPNDNGAVYGEVTVVAP
jgi:hypothetical protein